MALKKKCRVCGKTYEACRTPNPNNVFRWRDVACSQECYYKYVEEINNSRQSNADAAKQRAEDAKGNFVE